MIGTSFSRIKFFLSLSTLYGSLCAVATLTSEGNKLLVCNNLFKTRDSKTSFYNRQLDKAKITFTSLLPPGSQNSCQESYVEITKFESFKRLNARRLFCPF